MADQFITGRSGEKIRLNVPDVYKPNRKARHALDLNRVIGIDTESIIRSKRLELKYMQLYVSESQQECIDVENENALAILFKYLIRNYGQSYDRPRDLKQRKKSSRSKRTEDHDGRDGRRLTLTPILLSFFNMPYDLGRILDKEEIFKRFVIFGQDSLTFIWNEYEIEVVYSVIDGGSPSFQWIIKDIEKRLAVRVYGFDGSNYFLCSLKDAADSLSSMGVPPKIDCDKDIFIRDHADKPLSKKEIKEFMEYSTRDAHIHKDLYRCISELLVEIDPCVLNKQGMIGMSAGASAWRMILNMCEENKISPPAPHFQEMGYKAYYGGISFSLKPGHFDDISIIDISSAYSHAASMIPAFETCEYRTHNPTKVDKTFKHMMWGIANVSGEALDSLYPPLVCSINDSQVGIYGDFTRHWCSIPELHIGIARGALRVDEIHYCYTLEGTNDGGYKRFIEKMFHIKNTSEKNGPLYNMAKLMLNSPTGKIVEKRKTNYSIARVVEGINTLVYNIKDSEFKKACKREYIENGFNAVLILHENYLRDHDMMSAEQCPNEIYLDEWFDEKLYDSGTYFNATLAANILGFTRAKLMAGASVVKAIQGDTDSLFFQGNKPENFSSLLNSWGAITPETGLGSFDVEADHLEGTFVKKKLYTIQNADESIKKSGHHTMHKVAETEEQKQILESIPEEKRAKAMKKYQQERHHELQKELLEKGETEYTGAPKPTKMREAWKRGITCGEFLSHIMRLKLEKSPYHELREDGLLHLKPQEEIQKCQK